VIRPVTADNGLTAVGDLASSASPASWVGATRYLKRIIANLQELGFKCRLYAVVRVFAYV